MPNKVNFKELVVGDILPVKNTGPISRHTIGLYAAGSSDFNPLHLDSDFAKDKAGLPDVIVHGMFVMGYLAKIATDSVTPENIKRVKAQFRAMTNVNDDLTCSGVIKKIENDKQGTLVTLSVKAARDTDDIVAVGEIDIAVSN